MGKHPKELEKPYKGRYGKATLTREERKEYRKRYGIREPIVVEQIKRNREVRKNTYSGKQIPTYSYNEIKSDRERQKSVFMKDENKWKFDRSVSKDKGEPKEKWECPLWKIKGDKQQDRAGFKYLAIFNGMIYRSERNPILRYEKAKEEFEKTKKMQIQNRKLIEKHPEVKQLFGIVNKELKLVNTPRGWMIMSKFQDKKQPIRKNVKTLDGIGRRVGWYDYDDIQGPDPHLSSEDLKKAESEYYNEIGDPYDESNINYEPDW